MLLFPSVYTCVVFTRPCCTVLEFSSLTASLRECLNSFRCTKHQSSQHIEAKQNTTAWVSTNHAPTIHPSLLLIILPYFTLIFLYDFKINSAHTSECWTKNNREIIDILDTGPLSEATIPTAFRALNYSVFGWEIQRENQLLRVRRKNYSYSSL